MSNFIIKIESLSANTILKIHVMFVNLEIIIITKEREE
jgi:hypothetical protein